MVRFNLLRGFFGLADFIRGVNFEEAIVAEIVAMVIALATQFHKHFGVPRKKKGLVAAVEFDGSVVNTKMVTSELELAHGRKQIGFDAENVIGGLGNPYAPFEGDIVDHTVFLPAADAESLGVFFLKTNAPNGFAAELRETFAVVTKVTSVGGLQKRNSEAVEACGREWRREGIGRLLVGVATLFEIERIAMIGEDEDDVGEFAGRHFARGAVAIDFLMLNMFGGGKPLKIG